MLYLEGIPWPTDSAQCHAQSMAASRQCARHGQGCCKPKMKGKTLKSDPKHGRFFVRYSEEQVIFQWFCGVIFLEWWFGYIFTICSYIRSIFFTPNKLSFSFWRWQETMGLFQFRICFCLWFSSRCSSLRAHVTRLCHNLRTAGRGTKRSCVPVPGLWCHIV